MGKFSLTGAEYKISEETAIKQVKEFLEYYGKDPDEGDKDKQKSVESMLNRIVKYIRQGFVEIRPDMTIYQKIQRPTAGSTASDITYRKFKGSDIIESEGTDETKFGERINNLLGRLSGLDPSVFAKVLEPIDSKVSEAIGVLFFL